MSHSNAAVAARFGRANEAAARDAFRDRAGMERNDMFRDHPDVLPNEAKDRTDIPREEASRDHVDPQHVDAPRDIRERAGDEARDAIDRRDVDLDGVFEKVRASGAEVLQEPMDQPWGPRDSAFRDPSGNMVRISQAPGA